MDQQNLYRTATYWPPGSWESASGANIAVQVQAIWTFDGEETRVHLLTDVAEGGFLYDGITTVPDPRLYDGCHCIAKFYTYPDLRSLKQVRIAIVE